MALPTSRNTTYAPNSPILSVDLNAMQDCIAGRKTPATTRSYLPGGFIGAVNWAAVAGSLYILSSAGGDVFIPVPCSTGDRIIGFSYSGYGNGVVDTTAALKTVNVDMATIVTHGTFADNNRAAAWGTVVIPVTPYTILATDALFLQLTANAAAYRCGQFRLTHDRL